ncbi:cystatin-1-like [Thamnophis elegans]|uniref:cystatin-1-like n=1 Tax=Thamnophis elegans TaxID=35005 RepID=UPI001378709E|nr:cystatin-1-like [Thamnophis elegans]
MHSQLHAPSLLGLFGALLMLCPEQLLGNTEVLSDLPINAPGVRNVLVFAVEQYNKDKIDDGNYYKLKYVLKIQSPVTNRNKYCLMVHMVKTECEKTSEKSYREIQKCTGLPGLSNNPACFFKIMVGSSPNNMNLAMTACSTTLRQPPHNLFCSG